MSSSMTLCLRCCRVFGESIYFAIMQVLAWLSVAMISSCPWPMSRRADAIAASSASVGIRELDNIDNLLGGLGYNLGRKHIVVHELAPRL